ncbi:MAG: hypothetical protein BMS9Abin13_232 [Patescibacteria group bacterium]|nr:MAG: hypothetical protein BMS9Abin13_232 [Patescibacteria group bacterium]
MAVNIEVKKNTNENALNLIKRFSRRVKGSGILPRARSIAHHNRPESKFKKKQRTLKALTKCKEIERLKKLGKIPDKH